MLFHKNHYSMLLLLIVSYYCTINCNMLLHLIMSCYHTVNWGMLLHRTCRRLGSPDLYCVTRPNLIAVCFDRRMAADRLAITNYYLLVFKDPRSYSWCPAIELADKSGSAPLVQAVGYMRTPSAWVMTPLVCFCVLSLSIYLSLSVWSHAPCLFRTTHVRQAAGCSHSHAARAPRDECDGAVLDLIVIQRWHGTLHVSSRPGI